MATSWSHGEVFGDAYAYGYSAPAKQSASRYRLIRSPRFVKQLSDIRAAGRQQQFLQTSHFNNNNNGNSGSPLLSQHRQLNLPTLLLSRSTNFSNNSVNNSSYSFAPDSVASSGLLLMIDGYPSPRSSSTTASSDNLNPASQQQQQNLHHQAPSFVTTQRVQQAPRPLLVVPQVPQRRNNIIAPAHVPSYFHPVQQPLTVNTPNNINSGNSNNNNLAAISCLASPPWTRSTSPASTQSNPSSLSPPLAPLFMSRQLSPPDAALSSQQSRHVPKLAAATTQQHQLPPIRHYNEVGVPLNGLLPNLRSSKEPSVLPQPAAEQPPHKPVTFNNNNNRNNNNLSYDDKRPSLTPCSLISTTTRQAPMRSRSLSMPTIGPFCGNEGDDVEPFTLIPLPEVDAKEFPEQSWAYRNVRKLVSRLSAHVKARRRAAQMYKTTGSLNVDDYVTTTAMNETENYDDEPPAQKEIVNEELTRVSELVREQFGGSLSSVLKSARSKSLPPTMRRMHSPYGSSSVNCSSDQQATMRKAEAKPTLTLSSGRMVPVIRSVPSYSYTPRVLSSSTSIPQASSSTGCHHQPLASSSTSSTYHDTAHVKPLPSCTDHHRNNTSFPRCQMCEFDSLSSNTPLSRYGLRGAHVHLPPEELDMNTSQCDAVNFADFADYDETDIPRSALSPMFGYADPVADDMFLRSLRKYSGNAVRF